MYELIKKNWKRYLVSSIISFLVGFAIVFVSEIDTLTLESFKDGGLAGLLFMAVRAGFKALLEGFILLFSNKK